MFLVQRNLAEHSLQVVFCTIKGLHHVSLFFQSKWTFCIDLSRILRFDFLSLSLTIFSFFFLYLLSLKWVVWTSLFIFTFRTRINIHLTFYWRHQDIGNKFVCLFCLLFLFPSQPTLLFSFPYLQTFSFSILPIMFLYLSLSLSLSLSLFLSLSLLLIFFLPHSVCFTISFSTMPPPLFFSPYPYSFIPVFFFLLFLLLFYPWIFWLVLFSSFSLSLFYWLIILLAIIFNYLFFPSLSVLTYYGLLCFSLYPSLLF